MLRSLILHEELSNKNIQKTSKLEENIVLLYFLSNYMIANHLDKF